MRSGNCKCSTRNQKGVPMRDEKSLAHTRWNCKYHIVFAPKCNERCNSDPHPTPEIRSRG
ncbi:hypothetical protein YPN_0795 [Yersinia pestis Nepal516]|uniref:Transposase n=1 Tax=Yersinia pestis bv. Antiqua (strain Nepal516) TaxID=377628 RepID=A0A0H2YFM6_YERPN|nr:hypothetical protein YPN_0795 [Yersinia pestis Nepal516]